MKRLFVLLTCIAVLAGCSAPQQVATQPPEAEEEEACAYLDEPAADFYDESLPCIYETPEPYVDEAIYEEEYITHPEQKAQETQLPEAVEVQEEILIPIEIVHEAPLDPHNKLVESLDPATFAFVFWQGDAFHIRPVTGRRAEVVAAVQAAQQGGIAGLPEIVVDIEGAAYSWAKREATQAYLWENRDALNIWSVEFGGIETKGLVVVMYEGATEADRQAVLAASPISYLTFECESARVIPILFPH